MTEVDYFDWRGFLQRWVGGCAKCCQGFERDFYMARNGASALFGSPDFWLPKFIGTPNWNKLALTLSFL